MFEEAVQFSKTDLDSGRSSRTRRKRHLGSYRWIPTQNAGHRLSDIRLKSGTDHRCKHDYCWREFYWVQTTLFVEYNVAFSVNTEASQMMSWCKEEEVSIDIIETRSQAVSNYKAVRSHRTESIGYAGEKAKKAANTVLSTLSKVRNVCIFPKTYTRYFGSGAFDSYLNTTFEVGYLVWIPKKINFHRITYSKDWLNLQ